MSLLRGLLFGAVLSHVTALSISAPFGLSGSLTISVGSLSSFRLSIRFDGWGAGALASPSLDESRALAPATPVAWGGMRGLQAAFGALLVATDGSGGWVLYDAANATLASSAGAPQQVQNADGEGGVLLRVAGDGATQGPSQADNCLGNGDFSTPFFYNALGRYLAFPVSPALYDPDHPHCYPVSFQGPPQNQSQMPCGAFQPGKDVVGAERTPSYPAGVNVADEKECCYFCNKDAACVGAVFSSTPGAPPTASNCFLVSNYTTLRDAPDRSFSGAAALPPTAQPGWWTLSGGAADYYFAPAASALDYLKCLYQLTGAPGIPPRYAFGLMVTYWGYNNMEEVEGNMTAFRDGAFPIDAHIMDYDWWDPDYIYNDTGPVDYDFAYDPIMFGPHKFVHAPGSTVPNSTTKGPVDLLAHFHDDLHVKFSGIRKPRTYSHHNFSNASGWLLPDSFEVGAGPNNWNMTPGNGWSDWWIPRTVHFLEDGMDFWWNDEGETQFYTYTWWNAAQAVVSSIARPGKRFFTINRAFQPGMQRYPATTWTGDDQDCSHAKVLGYAMAGQPFHECDMTSPTATVLVRQYQNAILSPIFRVHQMHGVPRFPFLWGGAAHAAAFRAALDLRYALIPHLYSLAHAARRDLTPLAAPASVFFSGDGPLSETYVYGATLLPSEVSVARYPDAAENTTTVFLPPGADWFEFNTTTALAGGQTVRFDNVPLDVFRIYVRAGAIVALQGGPARIQHTGQLGGTLALHVYAGVDAAFTLFEDDGESLAYDAARATAFIWTDATRTLAWTVADNGFSGGPNDFMLMTVSLFVANASAPVVRGGLALGVAGSVVFP